MHDDLRAPDLTFPSIKHGTREMQLDLKRLLYRRGACIPVRQAEACILTGSLGSPLPERMDLVKQAHDAILGKLAMGGSVATAKTQVKNLTTFFRWVDDASLDLNLQTVHTHYIHWTDALHRLNVAKRMAVSTIYTLGRSVGQILDYVLDRETPILELTRLREPKGRKSPQGRVADKQNLESTFAFGHLLQDICDGLPLSSLSGVRPVRVPLRAGGELLLMGGLHEPSPELVDRTPYMERRRLAEEKRRRSIVKRDKILESGRVLVNMRILAELLMFIGQTGMSLSQAHQLQLRHFSYASDVDGYKVRDYKARRGGEVLFEIFKEYRNHFERYLEWRRTLFPDDSRLFPLLRTIGTLTSLRPYFGQIQQACKDAGVDWMPPKLLRSTRVNWLLRRSGDPDLTSEMAQHQKQTLLRHYEVPSQQRAIGEVTRFWLTADPTLCKANPMPSAAPGSCNGYPSTISFKPAPATTPDCIHPSGCLWCEHHRDIDAFDYVWALACFRHLKSIELSRNRPSMGSQHSEHPAHHALTRISEKLAWFRDSNDARRSWAEEAFARIDESDFHPEWRRLIEAVEGTPP
jgi:hypothetical protein